MNENAHAACVDAWLTRETTRLSPQELTAAFERVTSALWRRAFVTLGEVTLTAIVGRVLYNATERYPLLSPLRVGAEGVGFGELRQDEVVADVERFREAIRFVLVEFLTVLGNLTAEILTPGLHAELDSVELTPGTRIERAATPERGSAPPDDDRDEGAQ